MDRTTVYIQHNVISIIFILMNHNAVSSLSIYYIKISAVKSCCFHFPSKRANDRMPIGIRLLVNSNCCFVLLICARSSDFLLCRMSYMLTGRMSGTHRIRLFFSVFCRLCVFNVFTRFIFRNLLSSYICQKYIIFSTIKKVFFCNRSKGSTDHSPDHPGSHAHHQCQPDMQHIRCQPTVQQCPIRSAIPGNTPLP